MGDGSDNLTGSSSDGLKTFIKRKFRSEAWPPIKFDDFCARILRPLRVGPLEIHVCGSVCTDFSDKLPRGSRRVTALLPCGVLNEMIRNSQKSLFLDQFQTRLRSGTPGLRGPENDRFHCFWTSFKHDLGAVNRD